MEIPVKKIKKILKYKKYLAMSDKDFFDAEATIDYYINNVEDNERIVTEDYDKLFEEAKNKFGIKSFDEATSEMSDYFYELRNDDIKVAIFLGIICFVLIILLDDKGKNIEDVINKVIPKDFDKNNAFDLKDGHGHRIFGHDILAFPFKTIPDKSVIKVNGEAMEIKKFLDIEGGNNISMLDIIWKFYGNDLNKFEGIKNCLSHIFVHFTKDLLTPAGLPFPFTSIFNKYEYFKEQDRYALNYSDSLYKKFEKYGITIKMGDLLALGVVEFFIDKYSCLYKDEKLRKSFKSQMKLITLGTCLVIQMAKLVSSKNIIVKKQGNDKIVSGARLNITFSLAFLKISAEELSNIFKVRKYINEEYDKLYMG